MTSFFSKIVNRNNSNPDMNRPLQTTNNNHDHAHAQQSTFKVRKDLLNKKTRRLNITI